jgi:hypothetical protein
VLAEAEPGQQALLVLAHLRKGETLAALAWMTASGAGWLRRTAVRRWLERLTGITLTGIGLAAGRCGPLAIVWRTTAPGLTSRPRMSMRHQR